LIYKLISINLARLFYKFYFLNKHQPVIISGVSGSGKTTICNELKRYGYKAIDLDEIERLYVIKHVPSGKIIPGPLVLNQETVKQHVMICSYSELKKIILENSDNLVFYCGNLLEPDHLYSMFKKIYLLKVSDKLQIDRLQTRPGNFWQDVEVQKWLLTCKIELEHIICQQNPILINADRDIEEILEDILQTI
jgi:dephospho-CoA kinase